MNESRHDDSDSTTQPSSIQGNSRSASQPSYPEEGNTKQHLNNASDGSDYNETGKEVVRKIQTTKRKRPSRNQDFHNNNSSLDQNSDDEAVQPKKKRQRRPKGTSEKFRATVEKRSDPKKRVPCPAGCRHPIFTDFVYRINQKYPHVDVPRYRDGTVDWRRGQWTPLKTGYSWTTFLKSVISHFEYEIERGSDDHIRFCPDVIKQKAEDDWNKNKSPERSKYRKIIQYLHLNK